jgi:hypothetical protein
VAEGYQSPVAAVKEALTVVTKAVN